LKEDSDILSHLKARDKFFQNLFPFDYANTILPIERKNDGNYYIIPFNYNL